MKPAYLLVAAVLAFSMTAAAQDRKAGPDAPAPNHKTGSKAKKPASQSSERNDPLVLAGTDIQAKLQSTLDVRKNGVGDKVILKTTQAVKQNGEVVIPKGAQLIGRVTEVKRRSKENATSTVGVVFDRIRSKNVDLPVTASIVSVTTARATAAADDLFATDIAGSGMASGSASARGRSGGGGGLLGGVGSTVGGVVNTATSTVGSVAGTAVNTVGGAASTVGRTASALQISQSASGSANSSSNISANGRDVRIEKGASFQIRLDGSANVQE